MNMLLEATVETHSVKMLKLNGKLNGNIHIHILWLILNISHLLVLALNSKRLMYIMCIDIAVLQ